MLEVLSELGHKIANLLGEHSTEKHTASTSRHKDKDHFKYDTLSKELFYEAYDEETGLFYNRDTIGFVIEAAPLVGGDASVMKEIDAIFEEIMEEGSSVQCLLLADHRIAPYLSHWKEARKHTEAIYQEIASKRCKHYTESNTSSRAFRFILSYSVPHHNKITPALKESMIEKKEKLLKLFKVLSYSFIWGPQDLIDTTHTLISFSQDTAMRSRKWNPCQSLSTQLTSGGKLAVEENNLISQHEKSTHFKSYRVVDFPDEWSLASMHNLIGDALRDNYRINTPFFIHYGVHCPKQNKEEGSFWKKSQMIENQGKSMSLRRMIPQLEDELDECDFIRRSIKGGGKFVWTQLSVGLWSPKHELNQHEQALKGLYRTLNFRLQENTCIHLPSLLTALPMAWGEYISEMKQLNLLRTTLSTECTSFVPIQGEWLGTNTPGVILFGRRGQVLNWNPFDNKSGNYNTVVVGRSGSGKSVFMQELLMNGLSTGAKVYIIDVGRSFEKMSNVLNGQQIEFSPSTKLCLNPFSNIPLEDKEEQDTAFSFLKSVVSCMAAPTEGTTDYENAIIEKAIKDAWAKKKNKATITDVQRYLVSQEEEVALRLGVMLTPFSQGGIYEKYFEGKNNVNFNNPLVLIELEELKEKKDLQAVILQLFIMTITTQAFLGDRRKPFYICIDEAWDLLRAKQTGPFIETLARRLRKYFGALVVGTQSIEDFFTTPGAKAAYTNSDWMCLLSQKKSSIAKIHENGEFDERKIRTLETVTTRHGEYSEVMICDADGGFSIARLKLDPFSQLLYSTKAEDVYQLNTLKNNGLSTVEALNHMLSESRVV